MPDILVHFVHIVSLHSSWVDLQVTEWEIVYEGPGMRMLQKR